MATEKIGRIAFLVGLVIAVIAGFFDIGALGLTALVLLGVVVGLLNVTGKEVDKFLLGAVALMLVGVSGTTLAIPVITGILNAFIAFVAGAALIVALKEVYAITKAK